MKNLKLIFATLFFVSLLQSYGQHVAMAFKDANTKGVSFDSVEKVYKSALHTDTSLAVFKTDAEQDSMHSAYVKLLQDFGKFLKENNFNWDVPTKCWQRIYFKEDGTIDYFYYNFLTKNVKPEDQLSEEKQKEFNRLLNIFIQDYKLSVSANVKFAQCSPTTYMPKK